MQRGYLVNDSPDAVDWRRLISSDSHGRQVGRLSMRLAVNEAWKRRDSRMEYCISFWHDIE